MCAFAPALNPRGRGAETGWDILAWIKLGVWLFFKGKLAGACRTGEIGRDANDRINSGLAWPAANPSAGFMDGKKHPWDQPVPPTVGSQALLEQGRDGVAPSPAGLTQRKSWSRGQRSLANQSLCLQGLWGEEGRVKSRARQKIRLRDSGRWIWRGIFS